MPQTVSVPRKKKTPAQDRHKPSRMARVRDSLAKKLDDLADRNATDFTEELNRAVRELLQREGLWPPASNS
jgi:hypothetical protein